MKDTQLKFDAILVQSTVPARESRVRLPVKEFQPNIYTRWLADERTTPRWLFDTLNREFGFTLDACATHANALCPKHFSSAEDALAQDWKREVVFMNPPVSDGIAGWMRKAVESAVAGATVVCLVPAHTDSDWWTQFALRGEVRPLTGPLHGESSELAVVIFRPQPSS